MKSGVSHIFQLIQAGKLFEAIEILSNATRGRDVTMHKDLILVSGNLRAQQRLQQLRLISPGDSQINMNKEIATLLEMAEMVEKEGLLDRPMDDLIQQAAEQKTKILFIASNPKGTAQFELEKEFLEIRKVFRRKRNSVEVVECFDTRYQDFFEVVAEERPDILHIAAPSKDEFLAFHRADDTMIAVPYEYLAPAFAMFKDYVKCLFLNTWCSATFLKQVSLSLGAALGSKNLISDADSILFSSGFYAAIAQGASYEDAFNAGKAILDKGLIHDVSPGKETYTFFEDGKNIDPEDDTPNHFSPKKEEEKPTQKEKRSPLGGLKIPPRENEH